MLDCGNPAVGRCTKHGRAQNSEQHWRFGGTFVVISSECLCHSQAKVQRLIWRVEGWQCRLGAFACLKLQLCRLSCSYLAVESALVEASPSSSPDQIHFITRPPCSLRLCFFHNNSSRALCVLVLLCQLPNNIDTPRHLSRHPVVLAAATLADDSA